MGKSIGKSLLKFAAVTTAVSAGAGAAYMFSRKKALSGKYDNLVFFNGKEVDYIGEEFEGASFAVSFGGLEINFEGATLKDNRAVLDIYGEFCGISIHVPKDWNVKTNGEMDKSGVANGVEFDEEDTTSPLLVINYTVTKSGLSIERVKAAEEDFAEDYEKEESYFADEEVDDSEEIRIQTVFEVENEVQEAIEDELDTTEEVEGSMADDGSFQEIQENFGDELKAVDGLDEEDLEESLEDEEKLY